MEILRYLRRITKIYRPIDLSMEKICITFSCREDWNAFVQKRKEYRVNGPDESLFDLNTGQVSVEFNTRGHEYVILWADKYIFKSKHYYIIDYKNITIDWNDLL